MQIRRLADVCQTKSKVLHERITHHRLKHVFIARKVISNFSCVVLSHKIHTYKPKDKRTFVQQLRPSNPVVDQNKVTTRHCGTLEARVTRVNFIQETKRDENSPQTSDFDFENLSSLQSFVSR